MRQGADLLLDNGAVGDIEPVHFEKLNLSRRVHPVLVLAAGDLDRARDHAERVGAEIVGDVQHRRRSAFCFRDPDGNVLMVAQA